MNAKLADATGTISTAVAGILLAALSLSAFGAAPILFGFLLLFLLATAAHRALVRNR